MNEQRILLTRDIAVILTSVDCAIRSDEAGTLHLLVNRAGGVVAQERGK